jgi:N-formylglutamate amidohydrolase
MGDITAQRGSHANRPRRSISQIVVLHIPHSSRRVPAEERQAILVDDTELNGELLRMTDAYTDELFPITPVEAGRVIFPLSRLVCDVERFPSDENEPMAARGMCHLHSYIDGRSASSAAGSGGSSKVPGPVVLAAPFEAGAPGKGCR